ncbi:MAG: adenine phosphoribosyltransferase [Bacteroidetes bacterium]|nr:MAG: adenine phosphoribosyltransferase [Bacteroidota bacterium]
MTSELENKIKSAIRNVPDFPKKGINFKDITPILQNPELCNRIADEFISQFQKNKIDAIIGIESRGFLFGFLLAHKMKVPFIPVRKKGKLPYETVSHAYELEYGVAEIEMHIDSIENGANVMIHDDLLATGGTADAAAELVKKLNGNIAGYSFLIELNFLKGREKLKKHSGQIISLIKY